MTGLAPRREDAVPPLLPVLRIDRDATRRGLAIDAVLRLARNCAAGYGWKAKERNVVQTSERMRTKLS